MRELDLNGAWEFRQAGRGDVRIRRWLPATVPGTVHTDLLAAGEIETPFYRLNELDLRWIEYADWVYRRTFNVSLEFLRDARAVWLEFDGLDTVAAIRLNGKEVGRAENMFHAWRFDARPFLKSGANQVEVEFASAARTCEERAARSRAPYRACFFSPRVWLRKAQYAGGWDWGPRFLTCGIWRPARLRAVGVAEMTNLHAYSAEVSERQAVVAVDVEMEGHAGGRAEVVVLLRPRTGGPGVEGRARADLSRKTQILSTRLAVENPQLWWPNGHGPQSLYKLEARLEVNGELADERSTTVGLRRIELVREKDAQGESFRFRVNGRDIFCKGANWIPGDSFLPRMTPERYRRRLRDARDAHMNMLRVWGGGVYEDPAFYELCDELGLMVWQDFMFACAEYPEDPPLQEAVRREAAAAVRRLRNHACLALWCGNNENQWFFDELWAPVQRRPGEVYYHDILPGVCREHDPHRPYWPGSPYGGPKANDPNFGDQHVWSVWGWWAPPEKYRESPARFVSEFGFQAMPPARTVCEFTAPEDRYLFSPVIDHHNRAEDGHGRIMKFLAGSLGVPRDLDDYIYLSQVQQAEAIRVGVEHWRRRWPATAGTLYWQLNDCWPAASWSAVDDAGRPKALWYASRRFFAPALVTLCPGRGEAGGLTDLDLWVTYDGADSPPVSIEISGLALDGRKLRHRTVNAHLPPNASKRLVVLTPKSLGLSRPERELVYVRMSRGKEVLSRAFHFFMAGKYLDWPDPGLQSRVSPSEGGFTIELKVRRLARAVGLAAEKFDGRFSDNYVDLVPGEAHQVCWEGTGRLPNLKAFKAGLAIRWMKPAGRSG